MVIGRRNTGRQKRYNVQVDVEILGLKRGWLDRKKHFKSSGWENLPMGRSMRIVTYTDIRYNAHLIYQDKNIQ